MTSYQQQTVLGYVDRNHAGDISANNTDDGELLTDADQMSVSALRTRLAAINGSLYTATFLNTMTLNDMRHAVRLNDHANTV